MMLIHDASGAVAVVSAESVRIVGEGCIVLNARAVYIHNQALTPEQAAIVKRGVMATLDDPAALEDLHGKHDVASVDLPPRNGLGVDGDGVDAHVGNLTVWTKLVPDFRRSESSLTVEAVAPVMVSGVVVPR